MISWSIIADIGDGLIQLHCGSEIQDTLEGWLSLGRDRVRVGVGLAQHPSEASSEAQELRLGGDTSSVSALLYSGA